jgi:plastocyanin
MTRKPVMTLHRNFLATACALLSLGAGAGTVQVIVTGADGKPAANAVVQVRPSTPWTPRPAPSAAVVSQQDLRYEPFVTVVPQGGSLRFVNRDAYDHHVRSLAGGPLGSVAPAKQIDLRMGPAKSGKDTSSDVVLDQMGAIVLGCHLHGSMRAHVLVSDTPWSAVSDAAGRVRIDGVPDGAAELRVWHPDQLIDQSSQTLQVGAATSAEAKLNFTPRTRAARPASAAPTYEPSSR